MSTRTWSSGRTTANEHERADERHQADVARPGGHAQHVLLGDAHLEVALRVGLLEDVGPGRDAEVPVEHDDARVGVGQLGDGLAEDLAHRAAHGQRHRAAPCRRLSGSPSSAIAMRELLGR